MSGELLSKGFMRLTGNELRSLYVVFCELTYKKVIALKARDLLLHSELPTTTNWIQKRVYELRHYDDADLKLDLFLEMARSLHIKEVNFSRDEDIENQCNAILEALHARLLQQDLEYRTHVQYVNLVFTEKNLIHYFIESLLKKRTSIYQNLQNSDPSLLVTHYAKAIQNEQPKDMAKVFQLDKHINQSIRTIVLGAIITSLILLFFSLNGYTELFGMAYASGHTILRVFISPITLIFFYMVGVSIYYLKRKDQYESTLLKTVLVRILAPVVVQKDMLYRLNNQASLLKTWLSRTERYKALSTEERAISKKISYIEEIHLERTEYLLRLKEIINKQKYELADIHIKIDSIIYNKRKPILLYPKLIAKMIERLAYIYKRFRRDIYDVEQLKRIMSEQSGQYDLITLNEIYTRYEGKREELLISFEGLLKCEEELNSLSLYRQSLRESQSNLLYKKFLMSRNTYGIYLCDETVGSYLFGWR